MEKYLTALLTAVTLGCAGDPPPADRDALPPPGVTFLTHDELKALLAERTTVRFASSGQRGTGILTKDGTARLDGGNWMLIGSWRIEGNRYCSSYSRIGSSCSNLQKTGDKSYTLYPTDGSPGGTWEIER